MRYIRGDETVVLALLEAQRHGERPPALRLRGFGPRPLTHAWTPEPSIRAG